MLSSDRAHILRHVCNESLLNIHKIFIDSLYNYRYPGRFGHCKLRFFVHKTTRENIIQVTILVNGWCQAISSKWKCQIRAFTPQPLRALGYCRRPSGWSAGQTSPVKHSHVHNFSRIIFKLGKHIHSPKILDEFDHRGSASLNMRIMDHLMSQLLRRHL